MRRYIHIIFARKWVVILSLLTVFIGTAVLTFTTPPLYQATASIYVEQKVEQQLFAPPLLSGPDIRIFLQTQLELISSRTVAQRTLEELGLARKAANPIELSKMIENLQGRIIAGSRTGLQSEPSEAGLGHSFIIFVNVSDSDPAQAVALVNTICQKYQEFFFEVKGARNVKAYNFLKGHLEVIEGDMRQTDQKLRDFELQQGKTLLELVNMQKGTVALYSDFAAFLGEYNRQLVELNTIRSRMEEMEKILAQAEVRDIPSGAIGQEKPVVFIQQKIITLEAELARLQSQFTEEYIPISHLKDEKFSLEAVREETMRGHMRELLLQTRMNLAETRERVESLDAINRDYSLKLDRLVLAKSEYTQLMREQEAADKVYQRHIEELENARLTMFSDLSKVANVYLLDEAAQPIPRVRPKPKVNMILAVIVGLLLGIALAFLADSLDHSIKSIEDVDLHLGKPLLLSLPVLSREMREYD